MRAGGWRKRSKGRDRKGEQQMRAEKERKKMRRSEGELEEIEKEENERRRRRRGEAWADRGASAAVSWTGRRCSETGGSRMGRLMDACIRFSSESMLIGNHLPFYPCLQLNLDKRSFT